MCSLFRAHFLLTFPLSFPAQSLTAQVSDARAEADKERIQRTELEQTIASAEDDVAMQLARLSAATATHRTSAEKAEAQLKSANQRVDELEEKLEKVRAIAFILPTGDKYTMCLMCMLTCACLPNAYHAIGFG